MKTQKQYELNERKLFNVDLQRIEKLPLKERRENQREFLTILLEHPEQFFQSVQWLIEGCYGHGAYDMASKVLTNKRMNRCAWLFNTVAALEYNVERRRSCHVWNILDDESKKKYNEALNIMIDAFNNQKEGE